MTIHEARRNICDCIVLLLSLLALPGVSAAANHYIWCGATGAGTGADFTNAFGDLPSSLVRGDTYVVAGSASCTYARHAFEDVDRGSLVIAVRKAQASQDSGLAGWQSSFETAQAVWTVPTNPDPEANFTNIGIWQICSDNYTFDGITGITDPALGGPSGFGFLVQSPNHFVNGILNISDNSCPSHPNLSNITISHLELTNVSSYRAAVVSSCALSGTTVTVTFSPVPDWALIVGDLVDAQTSPAGTLVTDGSSHPISSAPITSVTGSPNSSLQFTLPSGYSGNPCTQTKPIGVIVPGFAGSGGFYMELGSTDTFSNITLQNSYIHDTSNSTMYMAGGNNVTYTKNFFTRNRDSANYHSNGINDHPGNGTSSSNITFSFNWWQDISGTAIIAIFNQGSGAVQTDRNWNIYGNVFWHTDPLKNYVSRLITCFGTSSQPVACSHFKIFNNTTYDVDNTSGHANVDWSGSDASSTDVEVYDNIWVQSYYVLPGVSSGLVCYDETAACASTAQIVMDYNYYDTHNVGLPNDVHGQFSSVNPATFWVNAAGGDFRLGGDLPNGLSTSSLLPANNVDGNGNTRGADGTWDAGAFEFVNQAGLKPNPPTNLNVTAVH